MYSMLHSFRIYLGPLLILFLVLALGLPLQAVDPKLGSVSPPGVERGKEAVLNFHGDRLEKMEKVLFYKTGLEVVAIEEIKFGDNYGLVIFGHF